ncbi:MAG: hypothetical protein V1869_02065 [Candidatus Omnitrophota bacterium]
MKKNKLIAVIVSAIIVIALAWAAVFISRGAVVTGLAQKVLLKSGKPLQFGGYTVAVDRVEGSRLYGVKVSSQNKTLKAKSGDYAYMPEKNAVRFNLIDGVAEDHDPENPQRFSRLTFKQTIITLKLVSMGK